MLQQYVDECRTLVRYVRSQLADLERMNYPEGEKYMDTACELDDFIEKYDGAKDLDDAEEYAAMQKLALALSEADRSLPILPKIGKFCISLFRECAECGNADAMNGLGSLYYNGRLSEPDYQKAAVWYARAAELCDVLGATNLACVYYFGLLGETDDPRAFQYFSMGANLGDDEAMLRLGDMYRYGRFVTRNLKMAGHLYKIAYIRKGPAKRREHVEGLKAARIGDVFYEGLGEEKNELYALRFYEEAKQKLGEQILQGDKWHGALLETVSRRAELLHKHYQNRPDIGPAEVQ